MSEDRKTKVFWSPEEKASLCKEAGRLLYTLAASSRLAALQQAQESKLPLTRRRKVVALTGMAWFTEGVKLEIEALRSEVQQDLPRAVEHPDPLSLGLETLYPLVRKRLVSELASFLSDVLKEVQWPAGAGAPDVAAVGGALLRSVVTAVPSTAKLRAVLVVGLRGGQMEEVRREYGKKFDLRFCGSDESKDKLRFMCEQAEVSVALTDFISHSHEDILMKRAKKYVRSAGGLTRLKELLHGLEHPAELAAAA